MCLGLVVMYGRVCIVSDCFIYINDIICDLCAAFIQFPADDGYCSTLAGSEAECEAPASMFDNSESTCGWNEEDGSCVYRRVNFTVRVSYKFNCWIANNLILL